MVESNVQKGDQMPRSSSSSSGCAGCIVLVILIGLAFAGLVAVGFALAWGASLVS